MSKRKRPKIKETPSPSKTPKARVDPNAFYQQKPAWRISQMVIGDVYGWEILDARKLIFIKDKLSNFESMTMIFPAVAMTFIATRAIATLLNPHSLATRNPLAKT